MYVKKRMCLPKRYFFIFTFLCCCLYHDELSKYNFFVCEIKQLIKVLGFTSHDDQEKNNAEFCRQNFVHQILKGITQEIFDLSRIFEEL